MAGTRDRHQNDPGDETVEHPAEDDGETYRESDESEESDYSAENEYNGDSSEKAPDFDKVMESISKNNKLSRQLKKRKISPESIERALRQKPVKAQGKINPAKRYTDPITGNSVTIDDVTGEPFQVAPGHFKF